MAESIIKGFHPEEGPIELTADKLGKDLIVQGPEHFMTHEGKHYTLSHYFSLVDTDEYARLRIKTPADVWLHSIFFVLSSGGLAVTVYRDTSLTHVAGNSVNQYNKNDSLRYSSPVTEVCHTPGGSGAGTKFIETLPVGTSSKFNIGAGNARDSNEIILARDTTYLVEAISTTDGNKITLGLDFYYRP